VNASERLDRLADIETRLAAAVRSGDREAADRIAREYDDVPPVELTGDRSDYQKAVERAVAEDASIWLRIVCGVCGARVGALRRTSGHLLYSAEWADKGVDEAMRLPAEDPSAAKRRGFARYATVSCHVLLDWPPERREAPRARCGDCGELEVDEADIRQQRNNRRNITLWPRTL
jgi:hypothetical protein